METFCSGDVVSQETFCYGDVLLKRCFVWRRFVKETFRVETFCMCAMKSCNGVINPHAGINCRGVPTYARTTIAPCGTPL
jgi:hypothetical protein